MTQPPAESEYAPERLRAIFQGVFGSHPAHVALLDLRANILAVNDAWTRFGQTNGLRDDYDFSRANYLQACEPGAVGGDAYARDAYVGLLQVMRSNRPKYTLVYPCHSPAEQRWFRMWIQPQAPEADAIVVAHKSLGATRPREAAEGEASEPASSPTLTMDAQAETFRLWTPPAKT